MIHPVDFFSSSTITKTSVFDAINENHNIVSNKEEISPNRSNKRFKRLNTDNEEDSLPQLTIQSSIDEFITPTKQNRIVLKRKSPNIAKELSPTTEKSDMKTLEQESDEIQNNPNTDTSESSSTLTIEVKSPVLELPQYLRNRFAKQTSSRMVRPT